MNSKVVVLGLFFSAGVSVSAAPEDKVILAAMRLSEQPNYSWTSTVTDDARSYMLEGKREKGRCTWMRLPMVKSVAQRLGRQADVEIEAFFAEGVEPVIRTERGWQTLRELPRRHWEWSDDVELWPTRPPPHRRAMHRSAPGGADPFGLDPLDPMAAPPVSIPRTAFPHEEEGGNYSNAQFAVSHPHDELSVIVSSHAELNFEREVVTGALTPIGAALLLVRDGQEHIQPLVAAGAFKLVIRNGLVTRYSLRLEGIVLIERKQIRVRQASSTEVTQIGATRVAVPDEVRRKLSLRY